MKREACVGPVVDVGAYARSKLVACRANLLRVGVVSRAYPYALQWSLLSVSIEINRMLQRSPLFLPPRLPQPLSQRHGDRLAAAPP